MADITTLIKTTYPIIQGGMANIANADFAAAVSNAGALGLIAAGGYDTESLREQIRRCKSLTNAPFGVNIMLLHPDAAQQAQVLAEEGVSVVTTGAGSAGSFIEQWKRAGITVIPVVPSVAMARRAEKQGADAVIAEGTEAGGHIGELTTMALVPQVAQAVAIPVVAAGGIAGGQQILAAYALGACGVQIGTCLLVAEECPIHDNYKQALLQAKDIDTVVTGRNSGAPVRVLRNRMTKLYLEQEQRGASRDELEQFTLGSLRRAVLEGDVMTGSLMAGQVAGMLTGIHPVADIISNLFAEYQTALIELNQRLS